jgi:hypothetical protein
MTAVVKTITSAQYETDGYTDTNVCIRAVINGDTVWVPINNDNMDYKAIQEWVADGNTIQDAD